MKFKSKAIIFLLLILSISLYNPLINYLSEQAANPRGYMGKIVTNIWSSYFDDLSAWTIENTKLKKDAMVLDVGYGGGANIRNLVGLNYDLSIHGIDISKESYKTAYDLNLDAIEHGIVSLIVGVVTNMSYQERIFDYVFAIQTHMYWDNPKKGFEEIYRVMSDDSMLIISSEKDKINYHMDEYKTTESLTHLLNEIGFNKVSTTENGNWIYYAAMKQIGAR